MKKIIIITLLICSPFVRGQEKVTFKSLSDKLVDFLQQEREIHINDVTELKSRDTFVLSGLFNDKKSGDLTNGFYVFSSGRSHSKVYYLIFENNTYTILNITTRQGLDTAIKNTLDFCDREKYCFEITRDCVSRLIGVYYKINKNPENRIDINCLYGVKDTKDLP
jgi:hypothetical protein